MRRDTPGDVAVVPGPVRAACWVAVLGAVVLVAGTALFFTVRGQLAHTLLVDSKDPTMTAEKATSATTTMIWTLLAFSILLGGLQALFTWRAAAGGRGFRTVATIVLAFVVVFVLAVGSYVQLAAGVVLIGAVVLLYLPTSNAHFQQRSVRR